MVLSAALHQQRTQTQRAFDQWYDDLDAGGVYLFAADFPDYDRRMEAIAFATKMNMGWEMEHLTLQAI